MTRPRPLRDLYERVYADPRYGMSGKNRSRYVEALEYLSEQGNPDGPRLLDWGCGRGESLNEAAKFGFMPTGTEITGPEVERVTGYVIQTVSEHPDEWPPVTDWTDTDVVTCIDVLEHITMEDGKLLISYLGEIADRWLVLAISTVPDVWGESIGKPLHINVTEAEEWIRIAHELIGERFKIEIRHRDDRGLWLFCRRRTE